VSPPTKAWLNNERVITGVVKGMVVVVKEWSGWIKVWFPCGQDFFAVVGAWSSVVNLFFAWSKRKW